MLTISPLLHHVIVFLHATISILHIFILRHVSQVERETSELDLVYCQWQLERQPRKAVRQDRIKRCECGLLSARIVSSIGSEVQTVWILIWGL